MRKVALLPLLMLANALLTGCPRPVRPPPAPAPEVQPTPAELRGAALYQIDSAASEVLIHVYRSGALARLGHNHIVASKDVSGRAWLHPDFPRSGFELSFPASQLVVDDEAQRRAAGADFAAAVKPEDKEGTRRNMLRPEVLDAERYPTIRIRSARIAGSLASPQVSARITIRDAARDIEIPFKLVREGRRLRASGEFDLTQTDFGIKPFSVVLGALEVQDRLHVRFTVVASEKPQ